MLRELLLKVIQIPELINTKNLMKWNRKLKKYDKIPVVVELFKIFFSNLLC